MMRSSRIAHGRVTVLVAAVLVVATATAVPASAVVTLKAVVSVAPASSTINQRVTATISRSTKPRGDVLKSIRLNWGDGTPAVSLANFSARPTHHYHRAGVFTIALRITDVHGTVARGTARERVTAPPGRYTATNQFGGPFYFYVSYSHTAVQDVAISTTALTCSPGGAGVEDRFTIAGITIGSNGSFSATRTEHGIFNHFPATFRYVFSGVFGVGSTGAVSARGSWRETITFTDSAPRTCTTNTQPWSATRDAQPAQGYRAPAVGSYRGTNQFGGSFPLYVSGNHKSIQDVAIDTSLECSPGTSTFEDHLIIASAPIKSDGSFAASAVQHGVFAHEPATFTYTIAGHFHAVDSTGAPRAAGTWRETVTYTDNAARTCTTDDQPFTVARDVQPAQTTALPPTGTYTGRNQFGGPFTFEVSGDQASIQNVSISTGLTCTPGTGSADDQLVLDTTPLNADGSFTGTAVQSGTFAGQSAQFTYDFRGHFHSVGADGAPRAAGTFDETVTYTNGASYTCTTDAQNWSAELSP